MLEFEKKKLYITDTILRDAHQSHAATKMKLEDMLPACEILDEIGYWSIECWGGATFDTCMRFLDEDPWDRLRILKKAFPKTRLQMLLRGQNLLGYRHYADDVVDAFCRKAIENGIDVVRIFDALNDIRNMETGIRAVKKYGGTVEAALSYTISPVHDEDYFINKAIEMEKLGADIICIKDMANLLLPKTTYSLIKKLKMNLRVPIHLHTHNMTGTAAMSYMAAAIANVDIIDCALSPFSNGTSQPGTESIVAAFQGSDYDTGLDLIKLSKAAEHFKKVSDKMEKSGLINSKVLRIDPSILLHQIPGGMFSNLILQLKELGCETRLEEVLMEVSKVRSDFGYPPLVTPTSQIVGTQAILNVVMGRYKTFTKESKALLKGEYGALPGKVNQSVLQMAIGDEKPINCRPADLLKPEMEKIKAQYQEICNTEEDFLSCALFPQIAPEFIKRRDNLTVREIEVEWNYNK